MLECSNYCNAWTYVIYIELQNTEDQRTSYKLLFKEAFAFQQREKQNQVNRPLWFSGKVMKRNKETPGSDAHIDFIISLPPQRDCLSIAHIYL